MSNNTEAKNWLMTNWPNARAVDVYGTMKRYNYPEIVKDYIKNNWIKVSDDYGGTYCEKKYYKNLPNNHPYKKKLPTMDEYNKKALEIGKTKGCDEMVKHMFKHPETGRPLSYSEMRMFYG